MEYIALFRILGAIVIFCGVVLLVQSKEDIHLAALIYSVGNIIVSIIGLVILYKLFLKFKFGSNIKQLKKLLLDASPLVISGFMIAIYYSLDIIMLRYMKTEYEVGIYSAAYKIFLAFIIPFGIIFRSFLPELTRLFVNKSQKIISIFKSYSILMISFAIFSGIVLFLSSKWIVLAFYNSEYLLSVGPLSILSMNIMVIGINILFGNPLTIWEKQKLYTMVVAVGAVCNLLLNIILIPKYSYMGAALATLLSEVAVFIGVAIAFNKTLLQKFS